MDVDSGINYRGDALTDLLLDLVLAVHHSHLRVLFLFLELFLVLVQIYLALVTGVHKIILATKIIIANRELINMNKLRCRFLKNL